MTADWSYGTAGGHSFRRAARPGPARLLQTLSAPSFLRTSAFPSAAGRFAQPARAAGPAARLGPTPAAAAAGRRISCADASGDAAGAGSCRPGGHTVQGSSAEGACGATA